MQTELIFSTYNSPRALRLTLLSVAGQRRLPDSVCVADDGSGPETAAVIERTAREHPELRLRHVWHEDRGFEKNAILNKAIATSQADLLVFTDGDCMIHPGFVARHVALARPDRYCCGSLIRLSAEATASVTENDVTTGRIFDRDWLRGHGTFAKTSTWLKTAPLPLPLLDLLELTSPVRKTWCGANASAFREAILAVNGFDEEMKYGGGDKEFGIRLANSGVRGRHLRFSAPLVHLDHPRGYRSDEIVRRHREKITTARRTGKTWTEAGIAARAADA